MPSVQMPVLPEKGRPVDKAEATALTYSLGYVLRGLLKIPRTADADDLDQRDDRGRDPTPRPPARAQQQRKPEPAPKADPNAEVDIDDVARSLRDARDERELKVAWGRAVLLKKQVSPQVFAELTKAKDRSKARLLEADPPDQPDPDGSHEEELGFTPGDQ